MGWFDLLKNIQIAGQRTSSKDYVNPDDEDGECKEWWLELQDMLNNLADKLHPSNGSNSFNFKFIDRKSEEQLCMMREHITKSWYIDDSGEHKMIGNIYTPGKYGMSILCDNFGYDYKCDVNFLIDNETDRGPAFEDHTIILWKEMNDYPADYRNEIDAIERHLKTGGLLLSLMDKCSKYSIEEAKK
jgi:hypothetical protein